jgi:AmmeMemoRadiSam system protein B
VSTAIPRNAISFVAPHAGYVYSGATAGYTYKALLASNVLAEADTIVLLGPNHTGRGDYMHPISVSADDWEIPLGIARNDKYLSEALVDGCGIAAKDETAHAGEHSLEVQLPFMHSLFDSKRFCFVCMGEQDLESCGQVATALISTASKLNRAIAVVASSDLNHYESAVIAKKKDSALLKNAKSLDYASFNNSVMSIGSSACGYGPMTVAMEFASSNGDSEGIILDYSNSGDMTGDYSSVVSYLSMAFIRKIA